MDGRIVDTFPRPDVARGIFYEYLRTDDPISPDFTNHVVDGFPFLLGPLAQVKGMHVSAIHDNSPPQHQHERGLGKAVGNFADMVANHAGDFCGWAHQGATGAASHVANAAKAVGSTANSVKEGLERRRDELWSQVSALPDHGKQFLLRKIQAAARRPDDLASTVAHYMTRERQGEIQLTRRTISGPRGRVFRSSVSQWFGSSIEIDEELGNPTVYTSFFGNLIFVYLVHLYLLLLLVVSLPGTHQTKLVVARRSNKVLLLEDSNSRLVSDDASTESSSTDESPKRQRTLSPDAWTIGNDPINSSSSSNAGGMRRSHRKNIISIFKEKPSRSRGRLPDNDNHPPTSPEQSGMKKSLSYYL